MLEEIEDLQGGALLLKQGIDVLVPEIKEYLNQYLETFSPTYLIKTLNLDTNKKLLDHIVKSFEGYIAEAIEKRIL